MRSHIGPMKKITQMCRRHRKFVLNWLKANGGISFTQSAEDRWLKARSYEMIAEIITGVPFWGRS